MLKIVIFDDDVDVLLTMQENIEVPEKIKLIGQFSDLTFVEQRVEKLQPDLVLMDIRFDRDYQAGIKACAKIKKKVPSIKVVMLTGEDLEELEMYKVRKAFEEGADGYFNKPNHESGTSYFEELKEYVLEIHRGQTLIRKSVAQHLFNILSGKDIRSNKYRLTETECKIISFLLEDMDAPKIREAMNNTRDPKEFIQVSTVRKHLENIKLKLDCRTLQGVVTKVLRERMFR